MLTVLFAGVVQAAYKTVDTAGEANKATAEATERVEKDVQYVLYLGTNDKDTNEPVFSPEEAKKELKEILIQANETVTEFYYGGQDDAELN